MTDKPTSEDRADGSSAPLAACPEERRSTAHSGARRLAGAAATRRLAGDR